MYQQCWMEEVGIVNPSKAKHSGLLMLATGTVHISTQAITCCKNLLWPKLRTTPTSAYHLLTCREQVDVSHVFLDLFNDHFSKLYSVHYLQGNSAQSQPFPSPSFLGPTDSRPSVSICEPILDSSCK